MTTFAQGTLPNSDYWTSLGGGTPGFVLTSTGYTGAFSANGLAWSAITMPGNGYSSVAYSAGLFVAISSGSMTFATSPDGEKWTERTSTAGQYFGGRISVANGRFFAACGSPSYILASIDGINWQAIQTPLMPNEQNAPFSGEMTWFGGHYLSPVNYSSFVLTSTDAASWTLVNALPYSATWRIASNGSSALITAADSTDGFRTLDGAVWNAASLPTDAHAGLVSAGATYYLLHAYSALIHSSTDGGSWSDNTMPTTGDWQFLASNPAFVVAVRQNSNIAAAYQYGSVSLTIAGVVQRDDSSFLARTVRAYRRSDGTLIGSAVSDGVTGTFSIDATEAVPHYLICLDDDLDENALIFDNVTPT